MKVKKRARSIPVLGAGRTANRRPPGSGTPAPVVDDGEFPSGVLTPPSGTTRRDFFRLTSASMALAGVGACSRPPPDPIISYNEVPPERIPGVPLFYATSMVLDGYATGLLAESHEGRPTKMEGNPEHPASLGGTGVFHQASILDLYDPLRADRIKQDGIPRGWNDVVAALAGVEPSGKGLRFLLEPLASPTTSALLDQVSERFPEARITFYAPLGMGASSEAARVAFGRALQPVYDFSQAERIVALDADFLDGMPSSLRYARDFAERRRLEPPDWAMQRLYVAEPRLTPTGSLADERIACQARAISVIGAVLMREVLRGETGASLEIPAEARKLLDQARCGSDFRPWVLAAAADLQQHAGKSVVVVGPRQPWQLHLIGHLLNVVLGNVGQTVRYIPPVLYSAGKAEQDLAELLEEMRRGDVQHLIVAGGNPAYTLPPEAGFEAAVRNVRDTTLYFGEQENETSRLCRWVVPRLHYLESWGDARAWDGTISLIQPLVAPLHEGKTLDQLLTGFLGEVERSPYQLLRGFWRQQELAVPFERFWESALQKGFVPDSASKPMDVQPRAIELSSVLQTLLPELPDGSIEVDFYPDPCLYDGRFATNAWLQELPEPNTKLTWGNAVIMSPELMRALGVENEQLVEVELQGRRVEGPALALPGTAPHTVALHLGYGRPALETMFGGGFDVYPLRQLGGGEFAAGAKVHPKDESRPLAHTQEHFQVDSREIALHSTIERFRQRGQEMTAHLKGPVEHLLLPEQETSSPQWGMVIDLSLCSGCSACVVACVAENNIPSVGEQGVLDAREMHWLRIDRYYHGGQDNPTVINQPMMCQHCERAPCEYVCPVNATVHDPDGLNNMIYNRCIGTRFCSNNCPYKVRRFNWFDYVRHDPRAMQRNPDVTVRERGVMEKCTYCVQRIRLAQIDTKRRGVPLRTARVETACQQACPTRAIVFGDITDPDGEVRQWRDRPQRYEVLHETGVQPRTQYLVKISNPGPEVG